jgi:hypothetical protein
MKLSILLAVAIAGLTHCNDVRADCFVRSSIKLTRQTINAGPTDFQKLVAPEGSNQKCMVQYRVHIGDEWHTAEGTGLGPTEGAACARAMDISNGRVLAEVEPSAITSDTQMVCSDLPEIRIRRVRIGEIIWESETDMHRHEQERKYFDYKQTKCRMFTERNAKDRNLYTYQGIICKADTNPMGKWRVVDKY